MSTQVQATVGAALTEIGFEYVPRDDNVVGGDAQYRICKDEAEKLPELLVFVNSAGEVSKAME